MAQLTNLAEIKSAAEAAAEGIKALAKQYGRPVRLYLHWTAGHYQQVFDDYHISVNGFGQIYLSGALDEVKNHTWKRNSGAVGLAVCGAVFANSINNMGPEAPTDQQYDTMAQVCAVLCKVWGLSPNDDTILTHAEAADLDGYGPNSDTVERWDLYVLHAGDEAGSGGPNLRAMIDNYMNGGALNWLFGE